MSRLTNLNGWVTRDGEPVPGITPPSVRVRAGVLTPERQASVQDAYAKFVDAKKLSLAGGGYFTADRRLPDGTIVRMLSINNVDHVHVWAPDQAVEELADVTFWCMPWDADWIDEPFSEVFTIPRWLEIGPDADEQVPAADFLRDLARDENYPPPARYPGNMTWFAPPGHPLAGTVVSWWGTSKRYANSERDLVVAAAGTWGRTLWPLTETVSVTSTPDATLAAMLVAPTGGLGGAVGEHMFDMLGATELPPGVTAASRPTPLNRSVWINGRLVVSDFPEPIGSACLHRIGDAVYLRVLTILAAGSTVSAMVHQKLISAPGPGDPPPTWSLIGTTRIDSGAIAGLGAALPSWANFTTLTLSWLASYVHLAQPFFWNADGSKAVSVAHYITSNASSTVNVPLPRAKYGTHAVVEITVSGSTVSAAVIDQTLENVSRTGSSTTAPKPPEPPFNVYAENPLATQLAEVLTEYSSPIAADYRGVDSSPSVLKTHFAISGQYNETKTNTNAVYSWTTEGVPISAYFSPSGTLAATLSVDYESWATIAGSEISGTRTVRTLTHSANSTTTREILQPDPDDAAYYGEWYTDVTYTFSGSGAVGLWGLCAGDLRGEAVMLHNTPLISLPGFPAVCVDSQANFTGSSTSSRVIAGPTYTSITATVTDNSDAGVVCVANPQDMTSEECDRLLVPTMKHNIGSLSAIYSGGSTTITRSGPYGAGPWIALDALPAHSQMNPGLGLLALCPIPYQLSSLSATGVSRLAVNASRSPISVGGTYFTGSMDVVGGYGNTVLSASAITPDVKVQYLGAVFTAMTEPTAKNTPLCRQIERWVDSGVEFNPTYPTQPDPENPGDTIPFPHRGDNAILLDPIFVGPLP